VRTGRGFERLITFADAVVAIALTLLVLPLVEIPADLTGESNLGDVFADYGGEIGGFLLSFVVIWVLWAAHHRTMEYFDGYDETLMRLTIVWLFTIVSLPFTTQLLASDVYDEGAAPLYDGVLLVSSLSLVGLSWWGRRHPELLRDSDEVRDWLTRPIVPVVPLILLVALLLSVVAPAVGSWPLFALVLDDRLEALWLRARRRPARSR
jgi:uncharacterized membrane protein